MRISPISFKADDDGNIFGKININSKEWINSNEKYDSINEWKAFCQPLIQDTFERVKSNDTIQDAT